MTVRRVRAAAWEVSTKWLGFGSTLRCQVRCGACNYVWHGEVPATSYPQALCRACRAINIIPIQVD